MTNQQFGDRHVVMVTAPCPGHIIPFTQLARYLLSRGVRVSCFSTGMNYPSLERSMEDSFRGERIQFCSLVPAAECVTIKEDDVKYLHALSDGEMTARLEKAMDTLVPPPQCIINDGFTGWAQDVADKRGIPKHLYCTMSTNALFLIFAVTMHSSPCCQTLRTQSRRGIIAHGAPNLFLFAVWYTLTRIGKS